MKKAKDFVQEDFIGQYDTLIRYYLHENPSLLTDEEWALRIAHLQNIRKKEAKDTVFRY